MWWVALAWASSLNQEAVKVVVREHMPDIRACYQEALVERQGLEGKLVLRWSVQFDGAVSSVETVSTTLDHPPLETCVQDEVRTMQFGLQADAFQITYPFLFQPDVRNSKESPR